MDDGMFHEFLSGMLTRQRFYSYNLSAFGNARNKARLLTIKSSQMQFYWRVNV